VDLKEIECEKMPQINLAQVKDQGKGTIQQQRKPEFRKIHGTF
jgi:hypothetical protein